MRRPIQIASLAWCLLLLSSLSPIGEAQSRRFRGNKEAKPYTVSLPAVDKVELLSLGQQAEMWDGKIVASKTLDGGEARKVAALWRAQNYRSISAICHYPAFGIRFYAQGRLLAFATLCWECDNIGFIAPRLDRTQGFDGEGKKGQELLRIFRAAFPAA
jgi:hypothetical protein